MEEQRHLSAAASVANLRDVLSHLATLVDPSTPAKYHRSQLENAEEHLRRAILEPYLIVFGKEGKALESYLARHEQEVLPHKSRYHALAKAPTMKALRRELNEIADLSAKARAAKSINLWNDQWETGVAAAMDAANRLITVNETLKQFWIEYQAAIQNDVLMQELKQLREQAASQSRFLTIQRQAEVGATSGSTLMGVLGIVDQKLRKAIRGKPQREIEIQDALETLLDGAGVGYEREGEAITYSTKKYVPDFSIKEADLAVEVKLCYRGEGTKPDREKAIIAEINDDILPYKKKFGNLVFVVYDVGCIRDVEKFRSSFEEHPNVLVRVIKH